MSINDRQAEALELLDAHYEAFHTVAPLADKTGHPVPMDTRGWSQVLVSTLTGIRGLDRKKGADLVDGSDVKGANTWSAIDTPRFNGVIKAGRKADDGNDITCLDSMPHLYFVLWDETERDTARCRIWAVRTKEDDRFRSMCSAWYAKRESGEIRSDNFQLHPPRGLDSNVIRNSCGNLSYPLLFAAERQSGGQYETTHLDLSVIETGACAECPDEQPRRRAARPRTTA
jgi:hypothetical protein